VSPSATATLGPAATPHLAPRRPPLQVLEGRERRRQGRRRRTAQAISLVLVVGSLLVVVLGNAMLAQTQVRLSDMQAALSAEQTVHRQDVLALAQLETPSRIAAQAQQQLNMVTPSQVVQVPSVSLTTPLPPPKVAAAPTTTPSTTPPPTTTPATTTPATTPPPTTTPATTPPATTTPATAPATQGTSPPGSAAPAHATTGAGQSASVPGQ